MLPIVALLLPEPRHEDETGSADRLRVGREKASSIPAFSNGTRRFDGLKFWRREFLRINTACFSKAGLTTLGLAVGFGWVANSSAAELVESVAPADTAAPTEMASREMLATPPPKSGMMRLGGFELFPSAWSSLIYDDNINLQNGALEKSDVIWRLAPGLTVLGGNPGVEIPPGTTFAGLRSRPRQPDLAFSGQPAKMLLLNCVPTIKIYADNDQYNLIEQLAEFTGVYSFARLILALDQDYVKSQDASFDVGAFITAQVFTTRLTSLYELNDRMSVEVNGRYRNTSYDDSRYTDSRQWENQNWLNRQLTGKINVGLGVTLGYWDVDRSGTQTYEQVEVRAIYRFAEKMDVSAAVGGNWQQYSGGVPATWYPIFRIAARYRPVDATEFQVEAHQFQQVSASLLAQNYNTIGFSGSVRQRVINKWFVTVGGGYGIADYYATLPGVPPAVSSTYYSTRVGVDYEFTERWTAGAFYQHQNNVSDVRSSFTVNQIGVRGVWQF